MGGGREGREGENFFFYRFFRGLGKEEDRGLGGKGSEGGELWKEVEGWGGGNGHRNENES